MLDPTSAAAMVGASNASANLIKTAASGASAARRRFRLLGTYDPEIFPLNLDTVSSTNDDQIVALSATDVANVEAFLSSPEMEPVLAIFAIAKLGHPGDAREQALRQYRELFTNQARRWIANHDATWKDKIQLIIDRIDALYSGALPGISSAIDSDEIDEFLNYVQAPALSATATTSSYLDRVIEVSKDVNGLAEHMRTSAQIAHAVGSVEYQPIFTHTEMDGASHFLDLYVSRDFVDADDDSIVRQEELIPDSRPFRHVVMGNPGAGKTTFVQHFKKAVSSATQIPVIEVVCRHYAKAAWDKSLTQHIADIVNTEHAIRVDVESVETMLLLGRICIVFDGLDEVTDLNKRIRLISRIESLTSQYPVCSIIVTTRIIGYTRARLPKELFSHLRLNEFDHGQFSEYSHRWFASRNRPDLYESFYLESETVKDLRYNPLMLSLLCALYREHGSIPTDRRGVYHQCADLLFRRWDNHRQIEHEEAMPKSANRLMQEIARWVSSSPVLQDGIEQQQLVKVLAHSLVDRDGYEMPDAERDADSFVKFCAGRAWLLASFGSNERGQRLFRFTHRTFLEYFTAEDFARGAQTDGELVDKIIASFRKDETSVLPELLLQSYDHHRDNGAARVFKELVRSDASTLLLLRLMESASLPRQHRRTAFQKFVEQWHSHGISEAEFNLLLSLNPQARNQFVEEYLHSDGKSQDVVSTQVALVDAWAGRALSGAGGHQTEVWSRLIASLAGDLAANETPMPGAATANWLPSLQLSTSRQWYGWDAVVTPSIYGGVPGVTWWTIEERLARAADLTNNRARDEAIKNAYAVIGPKALIPKPLLLDFRYFLYMNSTEDLPWVPAHNHGSHPLDKILGEVALYITCALHEAGEETGSLLTLLQPFYRGDIHSAFAKRDFNVSGGTKLSSMQTAEATEFRRQLPKWLDRWFGGRLSLVEYGDAFKRSTPNHGLLL